MRRCSSIGASLVLLLLVVGCEGTTPDPKPSAAASGTPTSNPAVLGKPADAVDLDLDGSISSFEGYTDNHGQSFLVHGDSWGTELVVHGRVLEREPADAFGPTGAPILVIETDRPVQELSASYRFTPGSTANQNAVIGACDTSFTFGSIQFAVSPASWVLFYTVKKTATDLVTPIVPLAEGRFAAPLATDGRTEYTTTMRVDLDRSSVTVRFPGSQRNFTDPRIAQLWGDKAGIQIRRPSPTDGNIQLTHVWTWSPK